MTSSTDIKSIDVMKFIFALSIVILHSGAYTCVSWSYYFEKIFIRLAVPFFFVTSGYFFKMSLLKGKTFKNYAVRLVLPLVVWESVNIVLESLKLNMRSVPTNEIVIDMIKHILFYPYGALWYVQASIIGAAILSRMYKRLNFALILGGFGYAFALLSNNYFFIIEPNNTISEIIRCYISIFISARNGFFVGLFFMALGAKCTEINRVINNGIFLLFSFVLYVLEIIMLANKQYLDDGALYISQIILLPSLLKCLLKTEVKLSGYYSLMLRKLSIGLYYLHSPILSIFTIMGALTSIYISAPVQCILTICVAICICLGAIKSKSKIMQRVLGFL